jgi:lipoteichoic acid synthase
MMEKDKFFCNLLRLSWRSLALFSLSVLNLLLMHWSMAANRFLEGELFLYSRVANLLMCVADASMLLMVVLLLTRRVKASLAVTYAVTLAWSFTNVFYARFFHHYLTLSAMGQSGGLTEGLVIDSMLAGLRWTDGWVVLSVTCFVVLFRTTGRLRFSPKVLLTAAATPVIALILVGIVYSAYHLANPMTRHNTVLFKQRLHDIYSTGAKNAVPNFTRFHQGSLRVLASELYDYMNPITLTREQIRKIRNEQQNLALRVSSHSPNPQVKNVVFIILESFLSAPVGLEVDGVEITPFLNALRHKDDVYYNGHIHPNITIGESGDGQFIYMTGLLPLRDVLTVGEAKGHRFPALPDILSQAFGIGYRQIVMPTSPSIWEQESMNVVYRLDRSYSKLDVIGNVAGDLDDEQLFRLATQTDMVRQGKPFFSLVLSVSTHQPYREPVDASLVVGGDLLPQGYRNYLAACRYLDRQLKHYFDYLKREGVYDNSLIVIASDHHAHMDCLGMQGRITTDLPLFIINGNIKQEEAYFGPAEQLDVFTTILDVLQVKSSWHGFGHTLLKRDYEPSVTDDIWTMSDWIVRGHYFDEAK